MLFKFSLNELMVNFCKLTEIISKLLLARRIFGELSDCMGCKKKVWSVSQVNIPTSKTISQNQKQQTQFHLSMYVRAHPEQKWKPSMEYLSAELRSHLSTLAPLSKLENKGRQT